MIWDGGNANKVCKQGLEEKLEEQFKKERGFEKINLLKYCFYPLFYPIRSIIKNIREYYSLSKQISNFWHKSQK